MSTIRWESYVAEKVWNAALTGILCMAHSAKVKCMNPMYKSPFPQSPLSLSHGDPSHKLRCACDCGLWKPMVPITQESHSFTVLWIRSSLYMRRQGSSPERFSLPVSLQHASFCWRMSGFLKVGVHVAVQQLAGSIAQLPDNERKKVLGHELAVLQKELNKATESVMKRLEEPASSKLPEVSHIMHIENIQQWGSLSHGEQSSWCISSRMILLDCSTLFTTEHSLVKTCTCPDLDLLYNQSWWQILRKIDDSRLLSSSHQGERSIGDLHLLW